MTVCHQAGVYVEAEDGRNVRGWTDGFAEAEGVIPRSVRDWMEGYAKVESAISLAV